MKKKRFNTKLMLSKTTIANLSKNEMNESKGGLNSLDCVLSFFLCDTFYKCLSEIPLCGVTGTCDCPSGNPYVC